MGSKNVKADVSNAESATPAVDSSTEPQPRTEDQLHEPTPAATPEPAEPSQENPQTQTPKPARFAKAKACFRQLSNNKHVRTAAKVVGAVTLVAAGALGTLIYKGRGGA